MDSFKEALAVVTTDIPLGRTKIPEDSIEYRVASIVRSYLRTGLGMEKIPYEEGLAHIGELYKIALEELERESSETS
jgi:hypothetical protein